MPCKRKVLHNRAQGLQGHRVPGLPVRRRQAARKVGSELQAVPLGVHLLEQVNPADNQAAH